MDMDFKQLAVAIQAIAEEKNLPEATVKEVVEQALAAAYRRDYGEREQEVRVEMNLNTGDVDAYVNKEVVEEVGEPAYELSVAQAQLLKKDAKLGDFVEVHERVNTFGRVAAQTAKQVKLRVLCLAASRSRASVITPVSA
jgi:N utilization substance protein A